MVENFGTELVTDFSAVPTVRPTRRVERTIRGALKDFKKLIVEPLDFVIKNYVARRPHWPPSFVAHLREYAREYLLRSTYFVVRGSLGTGTLENLEKPQMLGVLRLIDELNGLLPMEKYLNIEFNSGGRKKIEPGNFAIRPDLNSETFGEILVQLLAFLSRRYQSPDDYVLLTYADRQSRILYKALGFVPVRRDELTIAEGVKFKTYDAQDSGVLFEVDGVEWMPLKARFVDLQNLLSNLQKIRAANTIDEKYFEHLTARYGILSETEIVSFPERGGSVRMYHHKSLNVRTRGPVPKASQIFQCTVRSSILEIWEKEFVSHISFRDKEYEELADVGITIPIADFPLRNGFLRATAGETIAYVNGILTVRRSGVDKEGISENIEMEVSPDFKVVKSVGLTRTQDGIELGWKADF